MADPIPNPAAPAFLYSPIFSIVTPPTGIRDVFTGRTSLNARSAPGETTSVGNAFNASAPASSPANASLGVAKPGIDSRPAALVAAMTAGFMLGDTTSSAPQATTIATS